MAENLFSSLRKFVFLPRVETFLVFPVLCTDAACPSKQLIWRCQGKLRLFKYHRSDPYQGQLFPDELLWNVDVI